MPISYMLMRGTHVRKKAKYSGKLASAKPQCRALLMQIKIKHTGIEG